MRNVHNLTEAEINVMNLAVRGYSKSYIANKLCITMSTVTTHLVNIYDKYGIKNDKTYNKQARASYLFMKGKQ